MFQRYRYRIRTSCCIRRNGRASAVGKAKAGVLDVEVSPTVEQRTAIGGPADLSWLAANVRLRVRRYRHRPAASRAVAGDES